MATEVTIISDQVKELQTTRPFGRPPKYQNADEFAELVARYFDECATLRDVPTISGLAVYLDCDRKTLLSYKKRDDFLPSIKMALARCEAVIESRALMGGLNATMSIFTLKNNYGWVDKTEVDNKHEVVQPIIGLEDKKPDSVVDVDDEAQD